jgi:alpha-amylase/alpha-mannosidase (GH57 family)
MLKVAILWHMHQPYYRDPATGEMFLPWVRLHCLKDYCDLPLRVGRFDRLKMTFNLVPSLIEQIDLYCSRQTTDRHLELTRKPVNELTRLEKAEIFETFFSAHPPTMIDPYPRYRRLYKKLRDCNLDAELAARTSSSQEIRDLTIWGNLSWIDPIYRDRPPFRRLFRQGEYFTEEDKAELLEAEFAIMADTIPTYRSLMEAGKIEVSFTPYFHPILPLLCDTDAAKEALPHITLPKNRFCHPEDAARQVALAAAMYRDKFGRDPEGMWSSEGSISEQAAAIMAQHGIRWTASDEQVLYGSMIKAGLPPQQATPHAVYEYQTPTGPISLFFRDHMLSDRIGFVYAGWDVEKAVDDFMSQLHRLEKDLRNRPDSAVVPVILDGENCWEYYPNDGDEFLNLFFEKLSSDPDIETVTMSEARRTLRSVPLRNILAGSWINHNFRVWIGHPEDNTAWDLLWEARRVLTQFTKEHPDFDPATLARAEKSLLAAEGSDWNWWYGDEHRGRQNDIFDHIYRAHVASIYINLGLAVPKALLIPISAGLPEAYVSEPEGTATPIIDGRLTHFYEWLGAGKYDCLKAGGTMHRAERIVAQICYVSDSDYLYLRIDFVDKTFLLDSKSRRLKVEVFSPGQGVFVFAVSGMESAPDWAGDPEAVLCAIGDIAEIGIRKQVFSPDGRGEVFFKVGVLDGEKELEVWPQGDPIRFRFAGQDEEIVWDL